MAFRVQTSAGNIVEIEGNSATIGSDSACAINFSGNNLVEAQHAAIKKVAGRWMIEAKGETLLKVANSEPGRVHWLQPGDVVELAEGGPELVFNPTADATVVATSSAVPATPAPIAQPENIPFPTEVPVSTHAPANPAAWAIGGGVLVASGAVLLVVMLWTLGVFDKDDAPVVPENQTATIKNEVPPSPKENSPVEKQNSPDTTTAEADVERAVYSILLKTPEGQTFQLGTAAAISPRRLLTTAGVISALKSFQESTSGQDSTAMTAFLLSPSDGKEIPLAGAKLHVHPDAAKADAEVKSIAARMKALETELENATDEASAKPLIDQLTQQAERRYQALEYLFFFDVGTIEINTDLTHKLPIATETFTPSPGTSIQLVGIPVEENKEMIDPHSPPQPSRSSGQILALRTYEPDSNVKRLIIKCERNISGQHWPGSIVLNSAGEIVGVYSRPTPPPFENQESAPSLTTHDIISIRRLHELN